MTKITLGFTGHRDKECDYFDLKDLFDFYRVTYDSIEVVHGGAKGFDTQVHNTVQRLNSKDYKYEITETIIRPDYKNTANKRFAPLKRNETIINMSDILVVLWDGRQSGGTWYTIQYAERLEKTIYYLDVQEE